ncbi:GPI transamidase component [Onygenales sp. PD_10]|nr:GPI transamidase component [Onygenales sp. PD_10]
MRGKNGGKQGTSSAESPVNRDQISDKPTMTPTAAKRALPAEKPEATRTRTLVIAAFWAVIIFLGLPMWWKTTSIYRARLPLEEMKDWADGKACRPVFALQILVQAPSMNTPDAENLIRTTQHALDDLNEFSAHHLRLRLVETLQSATDAAESIPVSFVDNGEEKDVALTVRLLPREDTVTPFSDLQPYSEQVDIFYPVNQASSTTLNSVLSTFIAAEVQKLFNEEKATIAYILSKSNTLGPSIQPSISGGQNSQASQPPLGNNREQGVAVMKSVAPQLAESIARRTTRSFKYAETYHLSFSLFTPGALPSSWDIEPALQEYLLPLLNAFSPISNFSIDTQVQVYANFAPTANQPEYDESQNAWTLKKEDLSSFINAAEWPLSPSIGKGPTINFILYIPSPTQSPLLIKENHATSWLIPQWGGVVILNPPLDLTLEPRENPSHLPKESLRTPLSTFSHQLLTLLGTPSSPSSLPLRLQTLVRVHTASLLLSASSTMGSLARLTRSLASIPIPITVANSVSRTLSHLSATCDLLREGRFVQALASARVAENEAERSFFEKSMVGQVYFPDEHKVAVYLPLLGPIGVPLVMGLIKEGKRVVTAMRKRRVR